MGLQFESQYSADQVDNIIELEHELGVTLPEDYKRFMQEYRGEPLQNFSTTLVVLVRAFTLCLGMYTV